MVNDELYHASHASATTTVSEGLKEMLEERCNCNVGVVLNGFEPSNYENVEPVQSERFRIVYAGGLHYAADHRPFFEAINLLHAQHPELGDKLEVLFYGVSHDSTIKRYGEGLMSNVQFCDRVGKREIIAITKGADLLIHFTHPGTRGVVGSKLTEYFGASRPVLAVPKDYDVADAFLKQSGSGISLSDPEEIMKLIRSMIEERRTDFYQPNQREIETFTRYAQCLKLADVLDRVMDDL